MNDVREISPGVTRIPAGIGNSYMVGSCRRWVLVDSGSPGHEDTIATTVRRIFGRNTRPEAIVLTHGHFDDPYKRTAGAVVIAGAGVGVAVYLGKRAGRAA